MKGTRHTSSLRRLVVLPAATLAAVAFAAPAHAEGEAPTPAVQEVAQVEPAPVTEVVAVSDVGAMPLHPARAVADSLDPRVAATPAETSESPANTPSSGWVLVEPGERSKVPSPQAAVISPPERPRVPARTPAPETAPRQLSPARNRPQYQRPRTQYQQTVRAVLRAKAVAASLRKVPAMQASSRGASIVSPGAGNTGQDFGSICGGERDVEAPTCPDDVAEKFTPECRWIPDCTSEGSDDETPLDDPECNDDEEQYRSEDEQYQPDADDPDYGSSHEDEIEPVSGDCEEDDPGHGSGGPVGGAGVQPPSGLDSGVTQPLPATAPGIPSPTAPAAGPQALTGAEPAVPPPDAVAVDERPTKAVARPVGGNDDTAQRTPMTVEHRPGRVLAVHTELRRRDARRHTSSSPPRTKIVEAQGALPRPRPDVLASHETTSAVGAKAGTGRWLLVFAMLLFGVALLRLAHASLTASPARVLLGSLSSRVRSKGLSRSTTSGAETPDRGGQRTGIRYRD